MFSSFLIVLIPILLISLLVNYLSIGIVKNQVTTSYTNSLDFLTSQLDSSLKNLELLSSSFYTNAEINVLNYKPDDNAETILAYEDLLNKLRFFQRTNQLDCNITIYLRNKSLSFSSKDGMNKLNDETNKEIMQKNPLSLTKWIFQKSTNGTNSQNLSYTMNNVYNSPSSIVVKIDIDILQIKNLLSNLEKQASGNIFLIDINKNSVFSGGQSVIDPKTLIDIISETSSTDRLVKLKQNGVNYRVIFFKSDFTGLIYGMYFSDAVIMKPINFIKIWIVVIFILSVGLAILYTFLSYRNILNPVNKLVEGMRQVKSGNLKIRIAEDSKAELGLMFTQFNKMVNQIDTLINEIYMERLSRQQVQLKLLQSQINPHFLYNCLNFIYQMSMGENSIGTAKMSLFLSKYFRYATKSNFDTIQLKEEIESVEAYMQIQKMRFSNKFDYYLDIPEEIKKISIPRLTIQPIVENAFVHGLENYDNYGYIWVIGKRVNNVIMIIVEDDGSGIKPEKRKEILEGLEDMNNWENSVGMFNTHWRLKLKYGEKAGLTIEQREPCGTKIVITIPDIEEI